MDPAARARKTWGRWPPCRPDANLCCTIPPAQTNVAEVTNVDEHDPDPLNNRGEVTETPKYADLSVTQPIWFSGLIFGSGFGYFVFKEIPDLWTWIGGIVVFSSVLIITYNERNKDQKNNKNIISSID